MAFKLTDVSKTLTTMIQMNKSKNFLFIICVILTLNFFFYK